MIEFLHKGAHIANVTGEKISESQVVDAVRSVIDEMRLTLSHFTVSPVWGDPPRYQLLVERGDVGAPFGDSLAHRSTNGSSCSTANTRKNARRADWPR